MDHIDELAIKILNGQVALTELPEEQVDAVVMRTYERAFELMEDVKYQDAAAEIVDALKPLYDAILAQGDDTFEQAVLEAESRGSFYVLLEQSYLH